MQDGGGAGAAPLTIPLAIDVSARASARRVTSLGVFLRTLRQRENQSVVDMADRLAAHPFGDNLGLAPETLSAFERGDAAPGVGFSQSVLAAYTLSHDEKAVFRDAVFLAADPFLREGAGAAGDETAEEALRLLTAPIDDTLEDAPQRAAALLSRRPVRRADPMLNRSARDAFGAAQQAGAALRRAVADADGRLPNAALTDGVELLAAGRIRVVFADQPLSGALFGGARDGRIAFSGPASPPRVSAQLGEAAPDGFVCLRAGLLAQIADGAPIARFALLHEIGRRLLGQGATPFFQERQAKDPGLVATPGLRRRGVANDRLQGVVGAAHPGQEDAPPRLRPALSEKAAANLFAFCALTDPTAFSPAVDRLDHWAAHYGAPYAVALAFSRHMPMLFGAAATSVARSRRARRDVFPLSTRKTSPGA